MRVGVVVGLLCIGCVSSGDYVPPVDDAGDEQGDFSPCDPPCPSGSVCESLRCVRVDAGTQADAGSNTDAVVAVTDSGTPGCCPLGRPGCGCTTAGGARLADGTCRTVCDRPAVGWLQGVDLHGCAIWLVPMLSCSAQDAGIDGGLTPGTDGSVSDAPVEEGSRDASRDAPGG